MTSTRIICAALLPWLLGVGLARAQSGTMSQVERQAMDGILVNQTITVAGQEFHGAFAALWSDKPDIPGYGLAIHERPSARRGTTIEVEHANRVVFRAWLPPARSQIRPLAEQAVDLVYESAVAAQVQQLLHDDDLAPDEF
jgi:curli production assembly/transport component CsgE